MDRVKFYRMSGFFIYILFNYSPMLIHIQIIISVLKIVDLSFFSRLVFIINYYLEIKIYLKQFFD